MPPKRRTSIRASTVLRGAKRTTANIGQAGRNAADAVSLAVTSGEVIHARLTHFTAGEAARMIPEKIAATLSASAAWMQAIVRAAVSLQGIAVREGFETFALAQKLATTSPLQAVQLQGQAAYRVLERTTDLMTTLTGDTLRTQREMIHPFRATARDNARRLQR